MTYSNGTNDIELIKEVDLKGDIEKDYSEAVSSLAELVSNLEIDVTGFSKSYLLGLRDSADYISRVEFIDIVQTTYILHRHITKRSLQIYSSKIEQLINLKSRSSFYEHYYEIQTGLLFGERFDLVSWEPLVSEEERKMSQPSPSPDFAIRTGLGDIAIEATSFSPSQFTAISKTFDALDHAIRKQIEQNQLLRYVKFELPADKNLQLDSWAVNRIAHKIAENPSGQITKDAKASIPLRVSWKLADRESVESLGYDYPTKEHAGLFAIEARMLHTRELNNEIFKSLKRAIEQKYRQVKECNVPILLSIRSGVDFFNLNKFLQANIERIFRNDKLNWLSGLVVITHRDKYNTYTKLHRVEYFWNENAKFPIKESIREKMSLNYYDAGEGEQIEM
ncbi:hypothetical protein [Sphingomonas sp. SAFR-052]|uniref:hypothetical protein n=1 Tax=Sphingomonas sp. SAFR-052 TaxID=3436867 RepID=UPI003F81F0B6